MTDYNEMYCRWAEAEFGLENVHKVEFETEYDSGCPTCGNGTSCVVVSVWYGEEDEWGKQPRHREEFDVNYDTHLINSLLSFKP